MYDITLGNCSASEAEGESRVSKNIWHLDGLKLLTQLRESHQLSLLSQLVQANVGKFVPCHKEWRILVPTSFFGSQGVNYMASQSTMSKTSEDLFQMDHHFGWYSFGQYE
jgi:hypothetical protein